MNAKQKTQSSYSLASTLSKVAYALVNNTTCYVACARRLEIIDENKLLQQYQELSRVINNYIECMQAVQLASHTSVDKNERKTLDSLYQYMKHIFNQDLDESYGYACEILGQEPILFD